MQIGILTVPFKPEIWPLAKIIAWAGQNSIDCLEVAMGLHLDPDTFKPADAAAIRTQLADAKVRISSLAYYNPKITLPEGRDNRVTQLMRTIDAASALGVDTVCTLAGFAVPGKSKMDTIRQDLPGIFEPVLRHAGACGIRIALENYFQTNIQHLDHWDALFDVLPQDNFGLNFDPSHLHWQGIDVHAAVRRFAKRIFHTHAKDVTINHEALQRLGVLEGGWWRYCIPGAGCIHWGEYLGVLRSVGYDGVLSIEHEDRTFSPEAGFLAGTRFLRDFIG